MKNPIPPIISFIKAAISPILILTCIAFLTYIIWHDAGSSTALAIAFLILWNFYLADKQREIDDKYAEISHDEEIIKMIEGIEEFEETYCEKDEHLLRKIKEKILTNLTKER